MPPAKHLSVQPFARGEFPNSPVDCLGRGDALRDERPLRTMLRFIKALLKPNLMSFTIISPHNIVYII